MELHFQLSNIVTFRNSTSFTAPAFLETNPNPSLILNWLRTTNNNLQIHGNPQPKQSFVLLFIWNAMQSATVCVALLFYFSLLMQVPMPILNHLWAFRFIQEESECGHTPSKTKMCVNHFQFSQLTDISSSFRSLHPLAKKAVYPHFNRTQAEVYTVLGNNLRIHWIQLFTPLFHAMLFSSLYWV